MKEKRSCPNCGAYLSEDDKVCYVCGEVAPVLKQPEKEDVAPVETEESTKNTPRPVTTQPAYQPVVTEPTTVPTTEPTTEETTVPTQPPTETKAVTEPTVTEAPSQGDEVNQGDDTPTE